MRTREYQQLMRHMAWADAEVWQAMMGLPAAGGDASTIERLHHIHVVQWAYLHIWREESPAVRELDSFADLADIREWGREFHRRASAYLEVLEEREEWTREVRFPWADQLVARFGSAQQATVSESLLQIALHSTYHRGQINARLKELGGEPPLVDFIAWIWQGRPIAR